MTLARATGAGDDAFTLTEFRQSRVSHSLASFQRHSTPACIAVSLTARPNRLTAMQAFEEKGEPKRIRTEVPLLARVWISEAA